MLEVKNLVKRYGNKYAVDDISFTVERGEILGFLGPNGAGKSTTMNIITGYLSSTEGTVTIDGHEILEDPIAAKSHIGYLPEQPPLYMDLSLIHISNNVHRRFRCDFTPYSTLPYHASFDASQASVVCLAPLHFRRRVTRPVSYYALF